MYTRDNAQVGDRVVYYSDDYATTRTGTVATVEAWGVNVVDDVNDQTVCVTWVGVARAE